VTDEKPKYQFRRRIDDIKDIVYDLNGGDPKKISSFLESIEQIPSIKDLFSQERRSVNIGNNNSLFSVNLKALEAGLNIEKSSYSTYLFPSDLIRALANIAIIFVKKNSNLSEFAKGELLNIKKWGNYDTGYQTIDEVAFIEHFDDLERMYGSIIATFGAHKDILNTSEKLSKLSEAELKKIIDALEKENEDANTKTQEKIIVGEASGDLSRDAQQAVVPQVSPSKEDGEPSRTQARVDKVLGKDDFTQQQKNRIQYETGWLYNRAVYEMFTAHGIDTSDVDPALLNNLRSDIYSFTSGLGDEKLLQMLGSASKRQNALLKFYPKFASNNSAEISKFYAEISNKLSYQKLTPEQKAKFKKFNDNLFSDTASQEISATELLRESLKDATGSDSEVLNKTVRNTLDAMILQYGIDQEFRDENGQIISVKGTKNNHDVIKILESMSDDKLKIIFDLTDKMSPAQIDKFRSSIKNYSVYRASELTFHIQNTTLSKGLMPVDSNSKIGAGQHNFMDSTRVAIKANTAEIVIGGIEEKTGKDISSRRREKIDKLTKQYKSFIPLWENLQPEEQRIVYNKFSIPFNASNKDAPLAFIPEFLFFDVSTFRTFKNIRGSDKLSATEQDLVLTEYEDVKNNGYFDIGNQLESEQAYSQFINDSYLYNMEQAQLILLADFINNGEALGSYPSASFFDNYSPRELMEIDQYVQETGYEISEPNKKIWETTFDNQSFGENPSGSYSRGGGIRNLTNRISNSKPYKKIAHKLGLDKNKLNPTKRMAKSLGKSAASNVFKGVSAVSNVILPGSGQILYQIGKKIGFKKTLAIAGSLLALLIAKTIYALSTIGGLIGGIVGGIVGFFAAGPVGIVPGLVVGANAGQAIVPANWFNSLFGGKGATTTSTIPAGEAALANSSANTAAAKIAYSEAIAAKSGIFFGLPIFLLAPGIATFIAIAVTINTIFIIQSAFLVPTPPGLVGLISEPLECSDSTNNLNIITEPNPNENSIENPGGNIIANNAYKIVKILEQGFWCYWNKNPAKPQLFDEAEFQKYPNHCVYNNSTPTDCEGDYKNLQSENALYWCTWLVRDSYGASEFSAAAQTMADQFASKPGYAYKEITSLDWSQIYPGDAFFLSTHGEGGHIGHVAIVVSSTQDAVITVDSNAYAKVNSYTVGTDGKVQEDSLEGLWVMGIGYKTSIARP